MKYHRKTGCRIGRHALISCTLFGLIALMSGCCASRDPGAELESNWQKLDAYLKSEAEKELSLESVANRGTGVCPDYLLAPGDVVTLFVRDGEAQTKRSAKIDKNGMFTLADGEAIVIGGLSLSGAHKKMVRELRARGIDGEIFLIGEELSPNTVSVSGEGAAVCGEYALPDGARITELAAMILANNEGFPASPDWRRAALFRNGQKLSVNLERAVVNQDARHNIVLGSGDSVQIPRKSNEGIFLVGQLHTPGLMTYREGLSVLAAIVHAGGFEPDYAETILLIRDYQYNPRIYTMNPMRAIRGLGLDMALEPGDIVFVPRSGMGVYNAFINQLMPTLNALNILAGPFGAAGSGVVVTRNLPN